MTSHDMGLTTLAVQPDTLGINTYPASAAIMNMNMLPNVQSSLPSLHSNHGGGTLELEHQPGGSASPVLGVGDDQTSAEENSTRSKKARRDQDLDGIEPPRNDLGKMICMHPKKDMECAGTVFDRKCEWVKHVDKHDRPYKCEEATCVDLRGFTYSGGLLRHQREVHKKFGGPKATVFCPFSYCKRSTGTGFTRSENLKEHIRRVHRTPEELERDAAEAAQAQGSASTGIDAGVVALPGSLPFAPAVASMDIQFPVIKTRSRKRKNTEREDIRIFQEGNEEHLRSEIVSLRAANGERDRQIAHLHNVIADREMQILKLENDFGMLMAQQGMAQQAIAHQEAEQQS